MPDNLLLALKIFFVTHRFEISNVGSLYFLIFLTVSVLTYYLFKRSTFVLLLSGVFFYITYSVQMTGFLFAISIVNFLGGLLLQKNKSRLLLIFLIIFDAGCLIYFKYANFFLVNLHSLDIATNFDTLNYVVIPLGISFFTFETIHYVVDIYRNQKPVKNPVNFLTFIFFFPTLIAGPIKRFENFVPQLAKHKKDYLLIREGLFLIVKGLFKKIVIANTAANFALYGFGGTTNSSIILIGIYAFAIQIFFDFSGYSDIARGTAALFGIRIPENFMSPYLATNVKDFWRRWHITLMEWLRDYIYIPLGGSKNGKTRHIINLLIVFFISGLWHGAGWNFIIWGIYNGILVVLSTFIKIKLNLKLNSRLSRILGIFLTFNLVSLGWIFFRSENLSMAFNVIKNILLFYNYRGVSTDLTQKLIFLSSILLAYLFVPRLLRSQWVDKKYSYARYVMYSLALIAVFLSYQTDYLSFIYFQF